METAVFLLFAFLAVASSGVVVAHKNPVYSTMGLVLTLFSVAVLFVLLGAPFLAALQILIYAGAIVVLFLFVLMLFAEYLLPFEIVGLLLLVAVIAATVLARRPEDAEGISGIPAGRAPGTADPLGKTPLSAEVDKR